MMWLDGIEKVIIAVLASLQIIFIAQKIPNVVTWSWFWVFSPLYVFLLLIGMLLLAGFLDSFIGRLRRKW